MLKVGDLCYVNVIADGTMRLIYERLHDNNDVHVKRTFPGWRIKAKGRQLNITSTVLNGDIAIIHAIGPMTHSGMNRFLARILRTGALVSLSLNEVKRLA